MLPVDDACRRSEVLAASTSERPLLLGKQDETRHPPGLFDDAFGKTARLRSNVARCGKCAGATAPEQSLKRNLFGARSVDASRKLRCAGSLDCGPHSAYINPD